MDFKITAQSTIRNFNTAKAQTISSTSQHKAWLEPWTLQLKAQIGTLISQHTELLDTLTSQQAQLETLTPHHKAHCINVFNAAYYLVKNKRQSIGHEDLSSKSKWTAVEQPFGT